MRWLSPVLVLLTLILGYLYLNKPVPAHDDKPLRDSIDLWKMRALVATSTIDSITLAYNHLDSAKQTIQTVYKTQYVTISGYTKEQLDSAIRSIIK